MSIIRQSLVSTFDIVTLKVDILSTFGVISVKS
jgi:hypothetical protein